MIDLKYTITKFDDENKAVTVTFEDDNWAEIRLTKPLPKNIDELENIIKQFAAPAEVVEAKTNPDADLSYINSLIGTERTTTRHSLVPVNPPTSDTNIDPEVEANIMMWQEVQFQKKVGEALVKLGVVTANSATIPVDTI